MTSRTSGSGRVAPDLQFRPVRLLVASSSSKSDYTSFVISGQNVDVRPVGVYRFYMDKLVFLMRRKEATTRESFFRHYLEFHSLLGLRLVPTLDGYTVNVADVLDPPEDDICHPDAVVEMWTRDVKVFMDIDQTFDRPDDREIIVWDDATFIGASWAWLVEETLGARSTPQR